ncbi:MAG: ROK family protein, partial [Pseudonocardiaceae bacterium]
SCSATPTIEGDATVAAIEQLISDLRARQPKVEAIGVGAAGIVEWPDGFIRYAPNNSYADLPLGQRLQKTTGLPTVVDNDANTAAWAEARFGAGAGSEHMIVLTVGTGIGGGLVLGGEVYRGAYGLGAEVGHIIVEPGGAECSCGNRGCLEAMASGTALARMGEEAVATNPTGLLAQLAGLSGKVTGEIVAQAAREGDDTAQSLFEELGQWLGAGIASLVTIFDPELVVIGGGLVQTYDLLFPPTQASFEARVFGYAHRTLPPLVPAQLQLDAGLVGAAALALHQLTNGIQAST